jgi:hypothetical protein
LSQSIGHYLAIKQILDDKNNFSIVEKINQLRNLMKCMKKKINIIEKVERKRKQKVITNINLNSSDLVNKDLSPKNACVLILRKLDKEAKKFEIIN